MEHYIPMNLRNFHTYKRKSYNNECLRDIPVQRAKVLRPEEFRTQQKAQSISQVSGEDTKLPRTNLYVSKEWMRLNKDFNQQPLVRNVQ
jgi:hypothetical protein